MIQILILLAMIPLALAGLRLVFALVKGVFGFIFFGLILLLMVTFGTSNHSTHTKSVESVPMKAEPERASAVDCSDVDQVLTGSLGGGGLFDRYYKGEQCRTEIEVGFTRLRLQLSPANLCGSPQPSLQSEPPLPKSLNQQAIAFRSSMQDEEFNQWVEKLYALNPTETELTLAKVRSTKLLAAFAALVKPSGDALEAIDSSYTKKSGSVGLPTVPLIAPFSGIVRGVYEKNERQECTVRLRDHSLCIQRNDAVTCNVFDWTQGPQEQICVDYLIR